MTPSAKVMSCVGALCSAGLYVELDPAERQLTAREGRYSRRAVTVSWDVVDAQGAEEAARDLRVRLADYDRALTRGVCP